MTQIEKAVKKFEYDFKPKKKIVLRKEYVEEFMETDLYKNSMNWYNMIKCTNSYAEAKQHNLV